MIYRHKRTGKQYRFLFPTFDATNQAEWAVYVCLDTGVIFSRNGADFAEKFEFVEYSQGKITPRSAPFPKSLIENMPEGLADEVLAEAFDNWDEAGDRQRSERNMEGFIKRQNEALTSLKEASDEA